MNQADKITLAKSPNTNLIIIALVVLLIFSLGFAGIGLYLLSSKDSNDNESATQATELTQDEPSNELDVNEVTPTTGSFFNNDTNETSGGIYTDYDESLLANADNGDVVLFFKANWCPTCRALDEAILDDEDQIPSDLTILILDYDNSTELKQKYGVTYQHTLVQVDSNGEELKQWSHSYSLQDIIDQTI